MPAFIWAVGGGIERQTAEAQLVVADGALDILFQGIGEPGRLTGAETIAVIGPAPITVYKMLRHEKAAMLREILLGLPGVVRDHVFSAFFVGDQLIVVHVFFLRFV